VEYGTRVTTCDCTQTGLMRGFLTLPYPEELSNDPSVASYNDDCSMTSRQGCVNTRLILRQDIATTSWQGF
jgi:hypothetical protein